MSTDFLNNIYLTLSLPNKAGPINVKKATTNNINIIVGCDGVEPPESEDT